MSEKNKNSDQFDKLFQRDEAEFDIPYNEEDWLKMEKKLDLRDAKIAYRRKIAVLAVAALFIISFLGYFTYENYVNINQLNRLLESQITNNDTTPDDTSSRDDSGVGQTEEEQTNLLNVPVPPEFTENSQNELSGSNNLYDADESSTTVADNLIQDSDDENSDRLEDSACSNCLVSEISNRTVTASLMQNVSSPGTIYTMANLETAINFGLPHQNVEDDKKSSNNLSGFSFSLKAAPDLSTVDGFTNFQNPGYSIGLDVGYQLNEKLSVSMGILRSVVRYRGAGGSYNSPGYLTGGAVPNQITGECILLDIPLTLKYNVLEFSQSRIFATAGVSSYIMLNEKYNFRYENEYQDGLQYSYNENTGSAHWMSNAGISIGIEIDVHPNWSLRVEPQIKLPLREVGIGNVRLYSMGSFFSLSYKF